MKKVNVLVTSSGSIVAQGIIKSLKFHNKFGPKDQYKYNIIGTDISYEASGLYRCDKFTIVKKPQDRNYIKNIIDVCKAEKVQGLFIGSDVELPILCANKELIDNKTGTKVISSQKSTVEMCRDKFLTNEYLRKNGLNSIPSCLPEDMDKFLREEQFPLVVKPRQGFGSKFFSIVRDKEELDYAIRTINLANWKPMIQKYLQSDSKEFTTGVTIDKDDNQIMSLISLKKILKHGQTYKAFIDKYPKVESICRKVIGKLGAVGPINIQSRIDLDDNQVKILEINPRFSASCPMRTVAGINEPDIMIRNTIFDEKIKIKDHSRLVCLRYWNETYLDLKEFNKISSDKDKIKSLKSEVIDYF